MPAPRTGPGRCRLGLLSLSLLLRATLSVAQQAPAPPVPPPASSAVAPGDAAREVKAGLTEQILTILAEPGASHAHWGVAVSTLEGVPLVQVHEAELFQPASTAKLFTTSAAMALLGSGATVTTQAVARGTFTRATGELRGDLVLRGAGDGNFSGRTFPYAAPNAPSPAPTDPLRPLAELADQIAAAGLRSVTGDVVGDDTLFPSEPYPIGWELDDLTWGYGAPVTALSVADNEMRLTVTPGAHAGQPAAVALEQAVPFYVVEATVTTAPPGAKQGGVQVERTPGNRALRVFGQIAVDAGADVEEIAISDPAEYAALALKSLLEARGVAIQGSAVALHRYPTEPRSFLSQTREPLAGVGPETHLVLAPVPCEAAPHKAHGGAACQAGETVLATHTSPALADDVTATNKTSQNLHAELLLRQLGRDATGTGSAAQGARTVRQFLLNAGLDGDDFVFYDGSGLSTHDLVTPRATLALLAFAARQPWFAQWRASLPVGGVDGTLLARFTHAPLRGRVMAKTGTLGEARALAGYLQCASGQTVVFSIMDTNHLPGSAADRDAMDRIVAAIAASN